MSMTYIPGVGASLKTGRSIAGPTWAGGKAEGNAALPQRRRPMAPLLPLNPVPALMPPGNLPSSGGGAMMPSPRPRASGSFKAGFAPDDGQRIQGFSREAAGLPAFGGLDEFYVNQEGTPGNRTNPAFYQGSENNNQPWSSTEIAGQLKQNNMELVPFAGQIMPVPKRENGGPVTPGQPYLVGERGPEVIIPQAPGQVIPTQDLTMLSDEWARQKVAADQQRQAASGITDLGGGFKTLSNRYGTGVAVPGSAGPAPVRGFADERGVLAPLPGGGFAPVPDPLAGTPWGTMNGIQPADPQPVRDYIAAEARAMVPGAMERQGNDLTLAQGAEAAQLANQIGVNLQNRKQMGLPMRAPVIDVPMQVLPAPASQRPATTNVPSSNVPLAQAVGLPNIPGLPMSAVRGGRTAMNRFLQSPQGQQAVGQQMLQQAMTPPVDTTPQFVPIPGTGYGMAYAGARPMGTLPMQSQTTDPSANLMADVERAESPLTLRTIMQRATDPKIIAAARKRLDAMTPQSTEDMIYRIDPETQKVETVKWQKGKKVPLGYQRMEDENNDGVPDQMQGAGTARSIQERIALLKPKP